MQAWPEWKKSESFEGFSSCPEGLNGVFAAFEPQGHGHLR